MDKITKSLVKQVRSLQQKKFRDEWGLFVAEGEKCVRELTKSFQLEYLILEEGLSPFGEAANTVSAKHSELEQMSSLRTPKGVIGIFHKSYSTDTPTAKRSYSEAVLQRNGQHLTLVLDAIQDPGNLGTIIRTCDWFGVRDIYCSFDTADCYNPKVVQATMGALARVRLHYVNLTEWLEEIRKQEPETKIYGTLLDGENMYEVMRCGNPTDTDGQPEAVVVMGNEGNGISGAVRSYVTHPVRIPSYPPNAETSESLNVSIATAIVLAELRKPHESEEK